MAYQSDYLDAPSTKPKGNWLEKRGTFFFRNLGELSFLEPSKDGPTVMVPLGVPVIQDGKAVDVVPFLQPRSSRRLIANDGTLEEAVEVFGMTSVYEIRCARFLGPKTEKDDDDRRVGPPLLHFIDDHPPSMRRKYALDGRSLPPTCLDILLRRAPAVISQYPQYRCFFGHQDERDNALREPKSAWFMPGIALNHGRVDCSVDEPLYCVHLLLWSTYKSMRDLVTVERDGYTPCEGFDHEKAGSRKELNRRFQVPDIMDPAGAPAITITMVKQKQKAFAGGRKSKSGEEKQQFTGNQYLATLAMDANGQKMLYPVPPDVHQKWFIPPEEMFWYPSAKEAFELIMNHSPSTEWSEFLHLLARGTDLESNQIAMNTGAAPQALAQQVQAAPALAPIAQQAQLVEPAPAPVAPPVTGINFGAGQSRKAVDQTEEAPQPAVRAPITPGIGGMPLPDSAFTGHAAAPADDPAAVKSKTADALERLRQMKAAQGQPPAQA